MNEEAQSVHGNVRTSSVFISQSGEWRLGGLEVLSSMKDDDPVIYVGPPNFFLGHRTVIDNYRRPTAA